MRAHQRTGRMCSRASCRSVASKTLTYIYSDSTAVLGPLATYAEPHAYDLCLQHSLTLTVPNGWNFIKQESEGEASGPNDDDLMAIADAVREAAYSYTEPVQAQEVTTQEIGRRGHLRAIPSN
ncbi:MAG: hypothetical protein RL414_76 [Actinomycetota bacterium]